MRPFLIVLLLCLSLCRVTAQVPVKDPLLDYYHSASKDLSPTSKVYVIKAPFTQKDTDSIFITDNKAEDSMSTAWVVYCPTGSGDYLLADGLFTGSGSKGPDYVGYVNEIRQNGALVNWKDQVVVEYLDKGRINTARIGTNNNINYGTAATAQDLPGYFGKPQNIPLIAYSIADLQRMYAHVQYNPPPFYTGSRLSLEDVVKRAEVIFVGTILNITGQELDWAGEDGYESTQWHIERLLKGHIASDVLLRINCRVILSTHPNFEIPPVVGNSYIFFATAENVKVANVIKVLPTDIRLLQQIKALLDGDGK